MNKNEVISEIKFHCSSVGALLVGGNEFWSESDDLKLLELEDRKNGVFFTPSGKTGSYTPKMKGEHEDLLKKFKEYEERKAAGIPNFELGKTGKTEVKKLWRFLEFGFKEPMLSKEVLKGRMTEYDCLCLLEDVRPIDAFRKLTNEDDRRENDFVTGLKDINYSLPVDEMEDIKSAWSLSQFMAVETIEDLNPYYIAQGNCYMWLYGVKKFRVQYCLVDTPEELIEREVNRMIRILGDSATSWEAERIRQQIDRNHRPSLYIDPEQRVKTFEFDYDPELIDLIVDRIEQAREYYKTIRI